MNVRNAIREDRLGETAATNENGEDGSLITKIESIGFNPPFFYASCPQFVHETALRASEQMQEARLPSRSVYSHGKAYQACPLIAFRVSRL